METPPAGSNGAELAELARLYIEHRDTDIHTGDNYVDGCPTCDTEIHFPIELERLVNMKEVG